MLISLFFNSRAQNSSLYEIASWKGFTDAAITYTFDDATSNQYTIAIPMFNEFNFDATFFPVINWSPNWSVFQSAAVQGHEIGSHTISHSNLGNLTDSVQNIELKNSQFAINTNITTQKCKTIAYPYCAPGADTIVKKYYFAARHCQGSIEKTTPSDFYNISSIACGDQGSVKSTSDFKSKADLAAASKGWCIYLLHGIDNDGGYSALSSDTLRKSLEYLDFNKDKFWVSTFGNVAGYIMERNCATVSELSFSEDSILLQVNDTLDDKIFNYPITIRRPLDEDWPNVFVKQNNVLVNSQIKITNTVKYVVFDIVPDAGDITIVKNF